MVAALKIVDAPLAGRRVDVRNVSHAYELEGAPLPVLDGVSFAADPGSFTALLGPSGCGKSTLLRLLAGLEAPSSGTLEFDGAAIGKPDPSRILVFQDPTLFPWRSVWDNVALGLEAQGILKTSRGRVDEALALVGLTSFAKAYPHQLSGGMAQRVALARALVNAPSLLLLDEPLGKLDSLTRLAMQAELVQLWQRAGLTALRHPRCRGGTVPVGARADLRAAPGADRRRHHRRPALSPPPRRSAPGRASPRSARPSRPRRHLVTRPHSP